MSAPVTGAAAETAAAKYLEQQGFAIVARNYKTTRCGIDIIARKDKCLYFVEVRYRSQAAQGGGLDYVITKKRRQMAYDAELWLLEHRWTGETTLAAIELTGIFQTTQFITDLVF